jgi:hypothetical protein
MDIDKSFVGKYVCYAANDGSFTWGRIKDQGFQNSVSGEKEVFILTDQITCRVARNHLELMSIQSLGRRIEAGTAGPTLLGPTDPKMLPDYQRFGDQKMIPAKTEEKSLVKTGSLLPAKVSEVPDLEVEMGMTRPRGLPMMQKVGQVTSSIDGHVMDFILRRYGYDTSVRRESLNMMTDIIDPNDRAFDGLTDGEVFLMAMRDKLNGSATRGMFGKKPLELNR